MITDYQSRTSLLELPPEHNEYDCDEECFPDDRVDLRPSEVVQSKLIGMLPRGMAIPVSVFHNCRDVRR